MKMSSKKEAMMNDSESEAFLLRKRYHVFSSMLVYLRNSKIDSTTSSDEFARPFCFQKVVDVEEEYRY